MAGFLFRLETEDGMTADRPTQSLRPDLIDGLRHPTLPVTQPED